MRRTTVVSMALLAGLTLMPLAAGAAKAADDPPVAAPGPAGVVNADTESFAMRVEYDIPLPAGSGNVAHVNGSVRRSTAGENSKGLAGSPTELDAVVSGKYVDPNGTGHPQRNLPQSECFYPGSLLSTHFFYPTDTQPETASTPPAGYSTASCSAGPTVELHAVDQSVGGKGTSTEALSSVLTSGAVSSDGVARPVKDELHSDTVARASGVSILGGVVTIGSVLAQGSSKVNGRPGGGSSTASVDVSDINAGGVVFSLGSTAVDGHESVTITAAGQTVPVDSSAAKGIIDAANAAIKAQGCSVTPLTTPDSYPQGFIFARQPPEVGVKPDGTLAASYRGGLLVTCDIPRSVSDPSTLSPQRAQMLFGFAYTSTAADGEPSGFGFDGLGGTGALGSAAPLLGTGSLPAASAPIAGATVASPAPAAASDVPAAAPAPAAPPPAAAKPAPVAAIVPFTMDPADRWLLGLLCLVAWGLLTHYGAQRFLFATAGCAARTEAGSAS